MDLINPTVVARLYRDLIRPQPPQEQSARVAPTPRVMTRADVDAILQRKRGASPEELQQMILREKEFMLTNTQRDQVALDLTVVMAQRARLANKPGHPTDEFIAKVLGYADTPYGLIERAWVSTQLRSGAQAIQRCKYHRPPECRCWAAARAVLWQIAGDKSPEGWAAALIYTALEELEFAARPERSQEQLHPNGYALATDGTNCGR